MKLPVPQAEIVALLRAEIADLEARRQALVHVVLVLSDPHRRHGLSRPSAAKLARVGGARTFNRKLYQSTVAMVRTAPEPVTTKALAQKMRARKLNDASLYYHLARAVKRGELARVGNHYLAPRAENSPRKGLHA